MHYYSIEFADNGDPYAPLTERQLTAGAQVVEALATHGVFPLQAANRPSQQGLAVHHMGRIAWDGHTSISRDFPWVPPTPCQVLTSTAQISRTGSLEQYLPHIPTAISESSQPRPDRCLIDF